MKSIYINNYIKSVNQGLSDSICSIKGEELDSGIFFDQLILQTKISKNNNGRIFFFGNGASAAMSNHMALDWSKNGQILALSLSDSSMLTALANDYSFENSFLEFLKIYQPTESDLVVTTSSSGNSPNVTNVLEYCNQNKIPTFGLSGLNKGNKTMLLSDYSLFVPMRTYGMVECIHQLYHHLWLDKYMKVEEWIKTESQNMDAMNFKL